MSEYKVVVGDCLETLRDMESESVHCCVTSPPYFGLRDYGHEGQIGLEPTPDEFVAALVAVFREVRRVLRDDGTLWLNLGDSYNSGASGGLEGSSLQGGQATQKERRAARFSGDKRLKHKDLIGIPWMVAFALRADGWHLRQDIIWHKPNPMPESVRDRCTKAHEYIFLLSKSPRYYFDAESIKERATAGYRGSSFTTGKTLAAQQMLSSVGGGERIDSETRNRRSVWSVTTKPYKGAHFATFPPDLIEPCILAGCPEGGTVLDPFGGSGTTAGVAVAHGRNAILCELNPEYAALVDARVEAIAGRQMRLIGGAA